MWFGKLQWIDGCCEKKKKKKNLLQLGANSGLHIIIFDEIDAICKQRGSMAGSTGVHDTVVNQLLSKIDGVEQLNNILVIGQCHITYSNANIASLPRQVPYII